MHRRRFLTYLIGIPVVGQVALALTGCSDELDSGSAALGAREAHEDLQPFGYYQGLGPSDTRSPSRNDGTTYEMPCILDVDVVAGVEKVYEFWHGHGGRKHSFTVTAENFLKLQAGDVIEIYTNIIEGHRHALRISPREHCEVTC